MSESDNEQTNWDLAKLANGESIYLELAYDDSDKRYTSTLIGCYQEEYLLVAMPAPNQVQQPQLFKAKTRLKVKVFTGDLALAFDSEIIHYSLNPFPLLYLKYPSKIVRKEVRRSPRASVDLPVVVTTPPDPESDYSVEQIYSEGVIITDLSTVGCAIRSEYVLGIVGSQVRLDLKLPVQGQTREFSLQANLRSKNKDGEKMRFGFEFADVEEDLNLLIHAYVYQKLFEEQLV